MAFTPENAPEFSKNEDSSDKLRLIERQFGWRGDDWHFRMLEKLTPNQVHGFFGHAKLVDRTRWFDGSSKRGIISYEGALNRFRNELAGLFGNIRIALATGGAVVKSFNAFQEDKYQNAGKNGNLTRDEIDLMFQLPKQNS